MSNAYITIHTVYIYIRIQVKKQTTSESCYTVLVDARGLKKPTSFLYSAVIETVVDGVDGSK